MYRERIFTSYTYLYGLLPMLAIFVPFVKAGLIMSIIGLILFSISFLFIQPQQLIFRYDNSVRFFYLIFIYSIFAYLFSDVGRNLIFQNPDFLFKSISYLFLPMVFAHGLTINLKEDLILSVIFKSILVSLFISFLFHVIHPDIYFSFLQLNVLDEINLDYVDFIPRFFGIYGNSMIIGCLSSLSVVFCLYKIGDFNYKYYKYLLAFSIVCSIISMQRASWVVTFFSIIFYLFLNRKYFSILLVSTLFGGIIFLTYFFLEFYFADSNLASYLFQRFTSLNDAVDERNHQWYYALNKFIEYPFGFGLGTFSHKAVILHGDNAATDGNFWRILVEYGIFGVLVYVYVLFSILIKAIHRKEFLILQLLIVFLFLSVGTNVMDLYYTSYLFYIILFLVR
jgi:hypothetical protein